MKKLALILALNMMGFSPALAAAGPDMTIPLDHGAPLQTDPANPTPQQLNDIQQINALWDQITDAYRRRDPNEAMAGLLKSDAFVEFDLVMPFSDPGWERNYTKTKEWMDQSKGPTEVDYFDRQIILLSPTSAYGIAYVHFVGTSLAGDKIDSTARHVRIIRKINGKWVCVLEDSSVPEDWSVKFK